jgi:hypothetical protein
MKGAIVRRLIVAASILAAVGFGSASVAQAQIVYGYSTVSQSSGTLDHSEMNPFGSVSRRSVLTPGYTPSGYTPSSTVYSSNGYSSGGNSGYSPLSAYVPIYPPMGSNYRLSPVRMYGSSPYGMGSGFGGMNSMNWRIWMNSGYGGLNQMWMRRP